MPNYCFKCKRSEDEEAFRRCSNARVLLTAPYNLNEVWGIKISPNNGGAQSEHFQHELVRKNHPIFHRGEICPVTKRCGIPLIIYSTGMYRPAVEGNEIAVKLRIEASDAFAPLPWQMADHRECTVIRKDRKPLTKELLETIYKFHKKILSYPLLDKGWAPWQGLLNPSVWQMFAMEYYLEQNKTGRVGFDWFFPPVC
ncbi:hypothetical protein BDP27DRAFT_1360207 [Rhodocollybia butyracea]|uniref:Uncharacterized protein n=1 Tax=Rhodocollybia butyracea TaxID=206335 RepID=A0A9P5UBZ3_9AGAR|nr:hypothetical protein BDP27DRAFT_1360207 [Rhodocollybia butyracea]